jgi:hypothetical protein
LLGLLNQPFGARLRCFFCRVLEAETLYQSVPDLSGPIYPGGICSSCNGVFRVFDTFVLASSATVDAVALSVYNVPFPVSINVSVWSIGNNLPNAELFSETFAPSDFSPTLIAP